MYLSFIIPVYNAEKYLRRCVESILNQTFYDFEAIFIDDASTDKSLDILNSYAHDKRIKIIEKANEGVSLARNCGLDLAQGEYLMFVDADDWIDKSTSKEMIDVIEKKQADVVFWPYIREFKNRSLRKKIYDEEEIIFSSEEVKDKLHRRFIGIVGNELRRPENADPLCTVWGKLYKRSIIEEKHIRFHDIREIGSYEDGLFNLHYFQYVQKAVYVNKYYYHYRKNNVKSITTTYNSKLYVEWNRLFDIMEEYIQNNMFSEEYRKALDNRIALSILGQGLNIVASDKKNREKVRLIRNILCTPRYRNAYKELKIKYFPSYWKVFYCAAKHGQSFLVFMLILIIQRIRK